MALTLRRGPSSPLNSYGNELWEFDDNGLMRRREASINDLAIAEDQRRYFGPRPENERHAPTRTFRHAVRRENSFWSPRHQSGGLGVAESPAFIEPVIGMNSVTVVVIGNHVRRRTSVAGTSTPASIALSSAISVTTRVAMASAASLTGWRIELMSARAAVGVSSKPTMATSMPGRRPRSRTLVRAPGRARPWRR